MTVDRTSKFLKVQTTKVNQELDSVNTEELLLMKLVNVNTNKQGWRGGSIFKPCGCKHQQGGGGGPNIFEAHQCKHQQGWRGIPMDSRLAGRYTVKACQCQHEVVGR